MFHWPSRWGPTPGYLTTDEDFIQIAQAKAAMQEHSKRLGDLLTDSTEIKDGATQEDGAPFDEPKGECRKSAESSTKPRLDLLSTTALEDIAEVLAFGADKYGAYNWCRGARWGRYYAALLRHVFAWWRGEDCDPETGKSHLAHAGCCLLFLMEYQRHSWGKDDRFHGPDLQPFIKSDGAS